MHMTGEALVKCILLSIFSLPRCFFPAKELFLIGFPAKKIREKVNSKNVVGSTVESSVSTTFSTTVG